MPVKHRPVVTAIEVLASMAAVAVAAYLVAQWCVATFAHPIGVHP